VYDSQGEQNSSVPADNFFAQSLLRRRCLHVGIEPIESPVPETAYGCDVPAAGALLDQRGGRDGAFEPVLRATILVLGVSWMTASTRGVRLSGRTRRATLVWTRGPTTPEKLAAFSKAKLALDQASARCSQIAQKIAEL